MPTELNSARIVEALVPLISLNIPANIHGTVGIGKSSVVRQLADAAGYGFSDSLRASEMDPTDVAFPMPVDGRLTYLTPGWWPELTPEMAGFVLFADEVNRGTPMVQNALMRLIHEKRVGQHILDPRVYIVSAVNDTDIGVTKMSSALSNRFAHLYMMADSQSWLRYAESGRMDPVQIPTFTVPSTFHPTVCGYMSYAPAALNWEPSEREKTPGHAFNTPRTWEMVSRFMHYADNHHLSANPENESTVWSAIVDGMIGQSQRIPFRAFTEIFQSLNNIDAILADPDNQPIPSDGQHRWCVATALAMRANLQTWPNIMRYVGRMDAEYRTYLVVSATRRDPALNETPEFIQWAIVNRHLLPGA